MKSAFTRRYTGPLSRSEAWACFTSNLALPGSGSLAAGKKIGYYQMAVAIFAFIITLATTAGTGRWMLKNWARVSQPSDDPFQTLSLLWHEIRWPLVGIGIFLIAILWAMFTSWQIFSGRSSDAIPPVIH